MSFRVPEDRGKNDAAADLVSALKDVRSDLAIIEQGYDGSSDRFDALVGIRKMHRAKNRHLSRLACMAFEEGLGSDDLLYFCSQENPPFGNWHQEILTYLETAPVVVVLITQGWLESIRERHKKGEDYVYLEVAKALAQRPDTRVLPVVIGAKLERTMLEEIVKETTLFLTVSDRKSASESLEFRVLFESVYQELIGLSYEQEIPVAPERMCSDSFESVVEKVIEAILAARQNAPHVASSRNELDEGRLDAVVGPAEVTAPRGEGGGLLVTKGGSFFVRLRDGAVELVGDDGVVHEHEQIGAATGITHLTASGRHVIVDDGTQIHIVNVRAQKMKVQLAQRLTKEGSGMMAGAIESATGLWIVESARGSLSLRGALPAVHVWSPGIAEPITWFGGSQSGWVARGTSGMRYGKGRLHDVLKSLPQSSWLWMDYIMSETGESAAFLGALADPDGNGIRIVATWLRRNKWCAPRFRTVKGAGRWWLARVDAHDDRLVVAVPTSGESSSMSLHPISDYFSDVHGK